MGEELMQDVVIQPYADGQHAEVADLLSAAYLEIPFHAVVFGGNGPEQRRQHRALFALSLPAVHPGTKLVAFHGGAVVGFAHWVRYPQCQPPPDAVAGLVPRLLAEIDEEVMSRLITWLRAWAERDPTKPHWHFGPFAVLPSYQGRGIGRLLMQRFCAELDQNDEPGYLETERPENVRFYNRSGFEVTSEIELFGFPNWFMTRSAGARVT
jgi:GNAT superfamily N-acetyltransferase